MTRRYFNPILESQPLSYALDRPQYYRNYPRESLWGAPVFFTPSDRSVDGNGQPGPGYKRGKPYNINYGMYGNCTWWVMGRCQEVNGIIISECIGDAIGFYSKYRGEKHGGSTTSGEYFGDSVQPGDIIVFADDVKDYGAGHVIFVEDKSSSDITVSESGYSRNSSYKGMACLVYKIKLTDLVCGRSVKLRPQSPYSEIAYGVIHTGLERKELPIPVDKDDSKNQLYIGNVIVNVRKQPSKKSEAITTLYRPRSYYNVLSVDIGQDYTWYEVGDDMWVAGCDNEIIYYQSSCLTFDEISLQFKQLTEQNYALQRKLDDLRKILNS